MTDETFGGSTSTVGYTDGSAASTGIPLPTGRAMANGSNACLITALYGYVAGRGASRSIVLSLGSAKTDAYTEAAGSSASSTGWKDCNDILAEGNTATFKITSNGSFYFGRGGSGSVTDNNGTTYSGRLGGGYRYYEAPSAPTAFSVQVAGPDSVVVDFNPPSSTGGSAVTGYQIEHATNSKFTGKTILAVSSSAAVTIGGLTPGLTYYFRVAAKNAVTTKAGSTSVYTSVISLVTTSAPSAPLNPAISNITPISFDLAWGTPASDGGSAVTSYVVQYTHGAADFSGDFTTVNAASSPLSITGLLPGTDYIARIAAVNSAGQSPWSAVASARTPSGAYVSDGNTFAATVMFVGDRTDWKTVEVYAGDGINWNAVG